METVVKAQTYIGVVGKNLRGWSDSLKKRHSWIPCPRCIGGNMYINTEGEHVCIQCGCVCSPDKITETINR